MARVTGRLPGDERLVEKVDILIAGGGLAGLTAGSVLGKKALVLEKESVPGGLLRSPTRQGFTIDLVPHVFFTRSDKALRLFEETMGEGRFFRKPSDIRVFSHSCLTRFPFQCCLHGLPVDVVVECLYEFANAVASRGKTIEDFHEFVMASFGSGIARHFLIPYNTKLWGVQTLDELTADWVGGKVITTDLRDVIEGAVVDRRFSKMPNDTFRYPRQGGIQTLGERMAGRVLNLRLGTEIAHLDSEKKVLATTDGTEYSYEVLIYTLPLNQVPGYFSNGVPAEVERAARNLRFRDVIGVHFGVERPELVPWHWMYYPEHEYPFYRVSFPSNMSPHTVPQGTTSIIAEVAVDPGEPVDEPALIERCLEGLRRSEILDDDVPVVLAASYRLSPAYVVYDKLRNEAVDTVTSYLNAMDIVTAGRFGEWRFFNMDHTMLSGLNAAGHASGMVESTCTR